MMMFYKIVEKHYIKAIGVGDSGTEIDEAEYNDILTVVKNKPTKTATTDYKLKDDLTWEAYDVEPTPEPEPTANELLEILLGGDSE